MQWLLFLGQQCKYQKNVWKLFKANNKHTRTVNFVFLVNFEKIYDVVLVFLLLNLNMKMLVGSSMSYHLFLYVQYFIAFLFFSLYFVFFHVCFIPFVEVFHKGNLKKSHLMSHYPEKIYLFKVKNWNIWKRQAICSMLTIKTPERYQWRHFGVYC